MNGFFKPREKELQKVVSIRTTMIIPNRAQPRTEFDDVSLLALAQSIKENGILQPICVRTNGVIYEIISGERRLRAAKIAGLSEVPCIIYNVSDEKSAVLALIENIQRQNLGYFEEALAIEKLISVYGLTQEMAAARLGKAQPTIANKLRLLRFTDAERNLLITGDLSEKVARALIRISDVELRISLLQKAIREKLSTAQVEKLVEECLGGKTVKVEKEKTKPKIYNLPIPRLYLNSINKIIKRMNDANINCNATLNRSDDGFYEYTIKFPYVGEI